MINTTISYKQLATINTPPPFREGRNWQAIHHKDLVDYIMEACGANSDWTVYNPRITLSKDTRIMTLTVPLHPKTKLNKYPILLGVTNGNTGVGSKAKIKFYAGIETEREDVWLSRLSYGIKHLKSVDVKEEVTTIVTGFFHSACDLYTEADRLNQPISTGDAEKVLMEAGRSKLIPWARIGVADNLFATSEQTEWNLLTAFAFALQRSPAHQQMEQAVKFKRLLP